MHTNEVTEKPPAVEPSNAEPSTAESSAADRVKTKPSAPRWGRRFATIAVVAVLALAGGYGWYDARTRIGGVQEELARRLRDIETDSREAKVLAKQAQETIREAQGKIAVLDGKLAESQSQQLALETPSDGGHCGPTRRA